MTNTGGTISLAALDRAETLTLDEHIWQQNIAALRAVDEPLAALVAATELPPHWRATRALDDSLNYRIELGGQPPAWFAGTAVPHARAIGLLSAFACGEQNPTLPTIAAGAELRLLLDRLTHYQCVYVFEQSPVALAAVLRLSDFAGEIRAGRVVLVSPNQPYDHLHQLLGEHPGLQPPGNIVVLPGVPDARISAVHAVCERIARETAGQRRAAWDAQVQSATKSAAPPHESPHFGVIALVPDAVSRDTSAALARAADELGWNVARCAIDGPRDVHLLKHAQTFAAADVDMVLSIGAGHSKLPATPGVVCEWYTRPGDVPPDLPNDGILRLGATPSIAAELEQSAAAGARTAAWLWGCTPPKSDSPPVAEPFVVLLADTYSDEPAAVGIEQPTHRALWNAARQIAAEKWESPNSVQPETLLKAAERSTRLELSDKDLRRWFLHLVENVLVPAALVTQVAHTISAARTPLRIVGQHRNRSSLKELEVLSEHLLNSTQTAELPRPLAAVCPHARELLGPNLVQAAALGWPLFVQTADERQLARNLGGVLRPAEHLLTFWRGRELREALHAAQQKPKVAQQRAANAAQHVCQKHSWTQRLRALRDLVASA